MTANSPALKRVNAIKIKRKQRIIHYALNLAHTNCQIQISQPISLLVCCASANSIQAYSHALLCSRSVPRPYINCILLPAPGVQKLEERKSKKFRKVRVRAVSSSRSCPLETWPASSCDRSTGVPVNQTYALGSGLAHTHNLLSLLQKIPSVGNK